MLTPVVDAGVTTWMGGQQLKQLWMQLTRLEVMSLPSSVSPSFHAGARWCCLPAICSKCMMSCTRPEPSV